jgi:chloride channel protein, CIC family
MSEHETAHESSTTEGLPVAPSLGPTLEAARVPIERALVGSRVVLISAISILVAVAAGFVAQLLTALIGLFTNLAFYGRFDFSFASPADHRLGLAVVVVPVIGGVIVGLIARFGSRAIRGHGIPEAMEQVITNQSRIPPRMTFLKPLSAAIAIGTGGPFGAEGPIIATGGALGSLIGQLMRTTAIERKTLLAAGAAAGMAATFGSPISAVLLAIELLLFELEPRSLIPVSLAAAAAAAVRIAFLGTAPVFRIPDLVQPGAAALAIYVLCGCIVGVASVGVTRLVYAIEDAFERLPIHWMWWPALGGVAVGVVGLFVPKTLGVGYTNIEEIVSLEVGYRAIAILCAAKLVSWSLSLGSGTSGGTLAPLFTIGGGLGALIGGAFAASIPSAAIDPRIAALVGMAAMFAGASRAVLASAVFAFETTRQPIGLLPLLGGCIGAYLISCLLMRHSIMTEKIARRGVRIAGGYTADFLDTVLVKTRGTFPAVTLVRTQTIAAARTWLASEDRGTRHQGFPVVDERGLLMGVVTRKDLERATSPDIPIGDLITRAAAVVFEDSSLREAVEQMVREGVGRLPIVARDDRRRILGILTRSDILDAHKHRMREADVYEQSLQLLTTKETARG